LTSDYWAKGASSAGRAVALEDISIFAVAVDALVAAEQT